MTRNAFLAAYADELRSRYPWARDPLRLHKFVVGVRVTLNGANTWDHDGPAVTAAWRAIGGKGRATLKALRALPHSEQPEEGNANVQQ